MDFAPLAFERNLGLDTGSADPAAEETMRREIREARGRSNFVEDGWDDRESGLVLSGGGEKWDAREPDLKLYICLNLGAGVLTRRVTEERLKVFLPAFRAVLDEISPDVEGRCCCCGSGGGCGGGGGGCGGSGGGNGGGGCG